MLSPIPWLLSLIAAVVRYERVASPVTRLQMLAPSLDSRPSPLEMRLTQEARVHGAARDHQVLAVALVQAEGRDPVVVAVEDAGLARRRHRRQDSSQRDSL